MIQAECNSVECNDGECNSGGQDKQDMKKMKFFFYGLNNSHIRMNSEADTLIDNRISQTIKLAYESILSMRRTLFVVQNNFKYIHVFGVNSNIFILHWFDELLVLNTTKINIIKSLFNYVQYSTMKTKKSIKKNINFIINGFIKINEICNIDSYITRKEINRRYNIITDMMNWLTICSIFICDKINNIIIPYHNGRIKIHKKPTKRKAAVIESADSNKILINIPIYSSP